MSKQEAWPVGEVGGAGCGAYCSALGVVHAAVWDNLGERDDPVVDLVSPPPLHWRGR